MDLEMTHLGMAMGQGGAEGWGLCPRLAWFCLAPSSPASYDGKNFLTPSLPLGAPWSPAPPRKILLFVNLPYIEYNFFNETYFIDKNILEITTKFIQSNQINF